ncbi:hypothetical protein [Nostoc sp.]|uniref:hypothetical protein n=1 Tax=Nostoc sp. TaxID=1180 RepID=UPI002FFA6AC1
MTILKAIASLTPFNQKLLTTRYYGAIALTLYVASSTAELRELYLSKKRFYYAKPSLSESERDRLERKFKAGRGLSNSRYC